MADITEYIAYNQPSSTKSTTKYDHLIKSVSDLYISAATSKQKESLDIIWKSTLSK